jgi:UDPglucose--hexose-1-phosphate uridylyltransferase
MDRPVAPEIRTDWLTGRTVILAEDRAKRPNEFAGDFAAPSLTGQSIAATAIDCPFCPRHESQTPPAVYTSEDEQGQWRVRVVPNKYPAVLAVVADDCSDSGASIGTAPAIGAHEVIIESPRHLDQTSGLSIDEFRDVLAAYSDRLGYWRQTGRFEYGLVFKNVGSRAGASLSHLHSQLIALPQLPPAVGAEHQLAEQHYAERERCVYCELIAGERAAGERIVFDRDGLIAFCPFASLQPGEVWLLPTEHQAWFERRPRSASGDRVAELLFPLLARVEAIVPQAAYNFFVRTAPWRPAAAACGHWRIEVLPRVNPLAGLELATGIHINPISPTRAAKQLRLR